MLSALSLIHIYSDSSHLFFSTFLGAMRGKISPSAFRSPRRVLLPVPPRRPWAQRYTVPLFPPENKNALGRLHCSGRSMTVVPPGFPHCADTHVSVTGVPVRLTLFSARQLQGDFPTSCTRAYTGRPLSSLSDADTAPLLRISTLNHTVFCAACQLILRISFLRCAMMRFSRREI